MGMIFGSGRLAKDEQPVSCGQKLKTFLAVHWKGVLIVVYPLFLSPMLFPFPPPKWKWAAYTLLIMAIFWVTECVPLAVTSFLPLIIFPLSGVMDAKNVGSCYINAKEVYLTLCCMPRHAALVFNTLPSGRWSPMGWDSGLTDAIMMFLGSLFLAYSVEQSGLHKRMAYFTIRTIGYSHLKLLGAMSIVTTFASMWITNTAATTMVIPINFALLKVFENEGLLTIYEKNSQGELEASDITTCYFCAATYSATIGGIGTLVGTGTNLVFKGLFAGQYPDAPEYLSFPKYSAFAVPYMIVLEIFHYCCQAVFYLGMFRKNSKTAKAATITDKGMQAAKKTIAEETKKLGTLSFWEVMVVILFGSAILLFFSRSPQLFTGWGDFLRDFFEVKQKGSYIKDSALAMGIAFLMMLCPSTLGVFDHFKAKKVSDLPKHRVTSVLHWPKCAATMPFSFSFLLGGGFALSRAAKSSGLNAQLGIYLKSLAGIPNFLIILLIVIITIIVTNFASNVAVANVFCPIAMQLAVEINSNPLWYCIAAGIAASFCFMFPVGTPGNLIVKGAALVPTSKMMVAGAMPTLGTIVITWFFLLTWAPVIWPDLLLMPDWTVKKGVVL